MAAPTSTIQYDKQVGFTFAQDFTSLSFNVTAVAQHGPDGTGPAYLLNGLTDMGYWYQVGISYNWGYTTSTGTGYTPGFQGIHEVFDAYGRSIYPTTGGGGAMPLNVNPNDTVQLSLYFSNNQVIMAAHDWNTTDTSSRAYISYHATVFNGQQSGISNNGFFTGLMTEQYYNTPDNSIGQQVAYSTGQSLSSSWMWMDEFGIQGAYTFRVFKSNTNIPVYYSNQDLQYFASNGLGLASNGQDFVTGLPQVTDPIVGNVSSPTKFQGQTATVTARFKNASSVPLTIGNFTITTANGNVYNSTTPSTQIGTGETRDIPIVVTLPSTKIPGTFNVTIGLNWQFYISSIQQSIRGRSLIDTSSTTVSVSSPQATTSPPSTTPPSSTPGTQKPPSHNNSQTSTNLTSLLRYMLPIGIPYMALAGIAAVIAIRRENLRRKQTNRQCPSCRHTAGPKEPQCVICGSNFELKK